MGKARSLPLEWSDLSLQGSRDSRGLYYKTLFIRNVQQMDKFHNKLVPHIVEHTFDKHTSLLLNACITDL